MNSGQRMENRNIIIGQPGENIDWQLVINALLVEWVSSSMARCCLTVVLVLILAESVAGIYE